MSGLVSYLSHEDESVVEVASEAIKLLASGCNNRKMLYAQSGLVSVLTKLTGSHNIRVKANALSAMKYLNKYAKKAQLLSQQHAHFDSDNQENDGPTGSDVNLPISTAEEHQKKQKKKKKSKKKRRKPRTFALQVKPGMDDERLVSQIEKNVIRVRGIISLTLDQARSEILVTSKKKKRDIVPLLLEAVRAAGGKATLLGQIGRSNRDPKTEKHAKRDASGDTDDDEEDDTGYLDSNDYFGGDRDGVLSRFGSKSLQARLAEQRRLAQERAKQQSTAASVAAAAGNAALSVASWFGY